jgi:hypothetical protein
MCAAKLALAVNINLNPCRRNFMTSVRMLIMMILFCVSTPSWASLCIVGQVKEVGQWVNPDASTSGITKAIFKEECRDASTTVCNGNICSTTSAVKLVYTAELWGKCHPTDCYWGKVDGVYTSSNWLRFRYDHGFASRMVWGQVWSGGINWLDLVVDTDFVDPARADYRFRAWMKRL